MNVKEDFYFLLVLTIIHITPVVKGNGCFFNKTIVPHGKIIKIPGRCQNLECYMNQLIETYEDCPASSKHPEPFKCLPGEQTMDEKKCVISRCIVDKAGFSIQRHRGCKVKDICIFPSQFKDVAGVKFKCYFMRCSKTGKLIKVPKKKLCSYKDLCRTRSSKWTISDNPDCGCFRGQLFCKYIPGLYNFM